MYQITSRGSILLGHTNKHMYTVYSLLSRTSYSFTVKPYNRAGEGPGVTIEVTTSGGECESCNSV